VTAIFDDMMHEEIKPYIYTNPSRASTNICMKSENVIFGRTFLFQKHTIKLEDEENNMNLFMFNFPSESNVYLSSMRAKGAIEMVAKACL